MIIVRLSGGLGNQMFEYAFGLAQAIRTGAELKLDISGYGKVEDRKFELSAFNVSATPAEYADFEAIGVPYWNDDTLAARARKKLFKISDEKRPLESRRTYIEPKYTYNKETLDTGKDVLFMGDWQSERYFTNIADRVRAEFTLKGMSKLAMAFKKQISDGVGGTPVSVHIRRGDYVSNPKTASKHGALPLSYYEAAVTELKKTVSNPVFYIFSDDIEWCKQNLSFLKPAVYVSDPELSFAEEITLMSLCRHHIVANSSFSWWGAWLDPRTDKTVIAPKEWFKIGTDTSDMIPREWKQI